MAVPFCVVVFNRWTRDRLSALLKKSTRLRNQSSTDLVGDVTSFPTIELLHLEKLVVAAACPKKAVSVCRIIDCFSNMPRGPTIWI